jgi:hypothetical protein
MLGTEAADCFRTGFGSDFLQLCCIYATAVDLFQAFRSETPILRALQIVTGHSLIEIKERTHPDTV